jgi:toxin ParE1/3/4
MKLVISDRALHDIELCIEWSAAQFGVPAARRYEELISTAIEDLVDYPNLEGAQGHAELLPVKLYHLRYSRKKAVVDGLIVKSPRHFIACRVQSDEVLEVLRLLHDRKDIETRLLDSDP